MLAIILATFFAILIPGSATAEIAERPGWVIMPTTYDHSTLVDRVQKAGATQKLGLVTQASATAGAKNVLDIEIPGNTVMGFYHPRYAVPMLQASIAAGIEAPIRVYVTENADNTATLSYIAPSHVFAPYMDEGGEKLRSLAAELDTVFNALAKEATGK